MIIDQQFKSNHIQFRIDEQKLTLFVKPAPIVGRLILYLFTILFITIPFFTIIGLATAGEGIKLGNLLSMAFFWFMAFIMLRFSLWNTVGKETLTIIEDRICYQADYGWFKNNQEFFPIEGISYEMDRRGYEDDEISVLCIISSESQKSCAVKLPNDQLQELIRQWKAITT